MQDNTAGVEMKTGLSLQTATRTNPCRNCTRRWDNLAWRRVPTSTQGEHRTSEQVEGQVVSSQSGSTSAAFNQTSYCPHMSCDATSGRERQCAYMLCSACLFSLCLGWSGWSQLSSCRWLTLVALQLSRRAWLELRPRSSSTCSQYWQLPFSPHAATYRDSPRRFVVTPV